MAEKGVPSGSVSAVFWIIFSVVFELEIVMLGLCFCCCILGLFGTDFVGFPMGFLVVGLGFRGLCFGLQFGIDLGLFSCCFEVIFANF